MKMFHVNILLSLGVVLVLFLLISNYTGNSIKQPRAVSQKAERKVLRILSPYESAENSKLLQDIADQYSRIENNPKVEIDFISKNDFKKEICLNLDQNHLADLIICDNSIMPALINLNVLRDLSGYIDETSKVSHYSLGQWNNTRSDGKYYGIPFTCDPYVLIWNKSLFEKSGVPVPKTWEDLKAAARRVQKVGIYGIGIGAGQPEEITALILQLLYSTGGSIREINGEGGIKVFELLYFLKTNKLLPVQCINWNQLDLTNKFLDGEIAMMINNLSALSVIKMNHADFQVGVAAVPYEKKENYMFHGKNIGISVTADYAASVKFLDYITDKSMAERIAEATETIPVQVDADYDFNNDGYAVSREFIQKQKEHGIAKSSLNSWFDISAAISDGIYQLLSETEPSLHSIADSMQDKVRIGIIEN
ncbi:ABC-type glycerol-3-phosphate transport system, substrate-binding protein [Anaerocolumna jejuensis DSM 15929]|uniref:ABC-type glycerol-3-phosphate transport system, substrate-binding protein n=1 Tax=Anaerocolumna jejuensis DSM 15929 TaxID=1121322 RepID=A0A1M6PZN9_9FIRM|nr:extracellular solute-binding protein [Anaerocolumna jejuensis]SHK13362.1 ABC-type glycerol-3-phosphate transport system, substrate-binding protein [Anaerocolumna jejuensis DSM 15929]